MLINLFFINFSPETEEEMYDYLMSNYVRYNATRAHFGIYGHPYRFRDYPYTFNAYLRFIDDLSRVDNVYFVTISQVNEKKYFKREGS